MVAIVIGRNEGERLPRSLHSAARDSASVVYVDSGSTDASVAVAGRQGAEVVALDPAIPFSAARARNEGFRYLRDNGREAEFIQFLDGDCELINGWCRAALETFVEHRDAAVVCGLLKERFPEVSVYNRLCDMEWNAAVGEVDGSGGIFIIRRKAFEEVGGFNASMIAGEEPELCVRLRRAGWKVLRIDYPMAWHDADIGTFGQWWRRNVRNGHAYAEGYSLHGRGPTRHWAKEHRSNWIWGLALPVAATALAPPTYGFSTILLGLYSLQVWRIAYCRRKSFGDSLRDAWLYGLFVMIGKFPNMIGQSRYWFGRLRGVLRRKPCH